MFPRMRITAHGISPGGRLEYSDPFFRSKASASRNAPQMSPNCKSQPLLTIICHESIRPSCDTVGDCVAPLPASSMTSGSRYPRRHHRASNSSGPRCVTTKTTSNKTIAELCLCFLCACSCQNANSSLFLKFLPLGILGCPERISRARLNPFHSLFFFSWLLVLLSLLGALQSQELQCHAPQVRTTESHRHRLAKEEAKTNAFHFSHRCTAFLTGGTRPRNHSQLHAHSLAQFT